MGIETAEGFEVPSGGTPASVRPLVSVIMPAYNAERFIGDALASVLAQEYPNLEILVVDDGSTDRTVEMVRDQFPLVTLLQQTNAGAASARNSGLRVARGDFICFLDADDGWFPGKLAAQVDYLSRYPEVGAVFHEWLVWRPQADGGYVVPRTPETISTTEVDHEQSGWLYSQLLLDCIVHTSTVMLRRQLAIDIGYFESGLITGEDYDYWLRLSRKSQIHKLARVYSYYRVASGSLTSKPRGRNNEYDVVVRAVSRWGVANPSGTSVGKSRIRKRLSQLAFDFGYAHYHNGDRRVAGEWFLKCIQHEPWRWRALVYFIAAKFSSSCGRCAYFGR